MCHELKANDNVFLLEYRNNLIGRKRFYLEREKKKSKLVGFIMKDHVYSFNLSNEYYSLRAKKPFLIAKNNINEQVYSFYYYKTIEKGLVETVKTIFIRTGYHIDMLHERMSLCNSSDKISNKANDLLIIDIPVMFNSMNIKYMDLHTVSVNTFSIMPPEIAKDVPLQFKLRFDLELYKKIYNVLLTIYQE